MKSSLISSSQPRFAVAGDLNSDQQMDIVVANFGTNTIGIFLSRGDQTFAEQQTLSTGFDSRPYSVVVSDFNHDNHLDIAVANYGINSVGVFLGNGNGTFSDQKIFSLGSSHPIFITSGDFNNDNQTDIVVVNYGTNTIGILLGHGNGSFQNQTTYFTAYDSIPYALAVADLNHDNQFDIAVANSGTNNIGIFIGQGNGTFASQQTYTTLPKSNPTSIAVADVNHDNQIDIIVSNNGTGTIGIFLGHGNGTFQAQKTYSVGDNSHPQYLTVGDLNRDNALDIIVVDSQNDRVHVLPGNGNGSFASITTYDSVSRSHPVGVVVADFDNNNQSDVAVVNYGTNSILLLGGYMEKPLARETIYFDGKDRSVRSLVVGDFNNDRILDIAFTAGSSIRVLAGLGSGGFRKKTITSSIDSIDTEYICAGDLNNDTWMDIVSANGNNNNITVFLGNGDGTFPTPTSYSTGTDSNPQWVVIADVNNDNRLDIISANTAVNTIGVFIGNGDGSFAPMVAYPTIEGIAPYSVATGDVDNDNNLDLVIADDNGVAIIFLGHGNGTFTFMRAYSTNGKSNPTAIVLADLNDDNNLDIVITNSYTFSLGVFLGYGNGTFTEQTAYSPDFAFIPYFVVVADFNNDDISDLATTNVATSDVIIFYGYGNGTFELGRRYTTGYGSIPIGIAATDFDGDKHLEIIVALLGTGDIAVLTEYDAAEFDQQTRYTTGSAPQPFSVTTGDVNNDNRSDIVVANSGLDNLGILLGLGNNSFGMPMTYPIGSDSYPQYVITCDINKDNQLDIVSVNSKANSISVIIGHGNGTFEDQRLYLTGDGSNPYAVAAADLNNDSRLDLVIANEGTDSIGILFGFDYTSFQQQGIYSNMDSLGTTGLIVLDLNNDTFLDIAAVFANTNILGILFGYGNGSFAEMISYSTENNSIPSDLTAGDLNNDNYLDIVISSVGTSSVGVFLGSIGGKFKDIMTYSTGNDSSPLKVDVGDFNNDNWLDIVVVNYNDDNVGILLGHGNGSLSTVQTYSTGNKSVSPSVTVGDFNNDGYLDIVVANSQKDNVGVFLGYGNGTFEDQKNFSTGSDSGPNDVLVADFNHDNQLDIVTANWNSATIGILLGYGNGSFAEVKTYSTGPGSAPKVLCISDVNHDNELDIAVLNYGTNSFVVLFGLGDGSFLLGKPYSTGDGARPLGLGIGDFNNDRRLDVVVGNNQAGNIVVFLANGNEPFGSINSYSIDDDSHPYSVTIDDFNQDGLSDIVVANYGTDSVGILLGGEHGTFGEMKAYSTGYGSAPSSVAIADLNNDTHLDIAVSNSQTDNIAILLGYGNGTFTTAVTYSTGAGSGPNTVAIGDFNDDNISDLVVANLGTNNILFLYGYGNGTFGGATLYSLGYDYRPYSIAVKDLNQDNWLDLVIACFNTNHVEILLKMC